jgi:hypothetical protein
VPGKAAVGGAGQISRGIKIQYRSAGSGMDWILKKEREKKRKKFEL